MKEEITKTPSDFEGVWMEILRRFLCGYAIGTIAAQILHFLTR